VNSIKIKLGKTQMSEVYGKQASGDPCCTFTLFSDGTSSDSDEDCEGTRVPVVKSSASNKI
jgi:hypothetical protein